MANTLNVYFSLKHHLIHTRLCECYVSLLQVLTHGFKPFLFFLVMLLKNMAFKVTMIEQRVRKLERCFKLLLLDAWGWCTGTTQSEGMGR